MQPNNEISMTGVPNTSSSQIQPTKLTIRESALKVDESIFYYLTHVYMENLFRDSKKDLNEKIYELEKIGETLGKNINERVTVDLLEKFMKDKEKQNIKNLEYIKFICKEFWIYLFGKPIDSLQTNHKGTFFLTDTNFKYLSRLSCGKSDENKAYINFTLNFVKSLIKGALHAFSRSSEVTVDNTKDAEYLFVIRVKEED